MLFLATIFWQPSSSWCGVSGVCVCGGGGGEKRIFSWRKGNQDQEINTGLLNISLRCSYYWGTAAPTTEALQLLLLRHCSSDIRAEDLYTQTQFSSQTGCHLCLLVSFTAEGGNCRRRCWKSRRGSLQQIYQITGKGTGCHCFFTQRTGHQAERAAPVGE